MSTVEYDGIPPLSEKDKVDLRRLAALPDDTIDYSDAPPLKATAGGIRGRFYIPQTTEITLRLDSDVAAWLTATGDIYHERLNAILRDVMRLSSRPSADNPSSP